MFLYHLIVFITTNITRIQLTEILIILTEIFIKFKKNILLLTTSGMTAYLNCAGKVTLQAIISLYSDG